MCSAVSFLIFYVSLTYLYFSLSLAPTFSTHLSLLSPSFPYSTSISLCITHTADERILSIFHPRLGCQVGGGVVQPPPLSGCDQTPLIHTQPQHPEAGVCIHKHSTDHAPIQHTQQTAPLHSRQSKHSAPIQQAPTQHSNLGIISYPLLAQHSLTDIGETCLPSVHEHSETPK